MLAGHSRGGDGLIAMAWRLQSAHVPVALAVAVDATRVVGKVPPNVERFINFYQSNNMLGGGAAQPSRNFHGEYVTVNLADHIEMTHVTIDKMPALHQAIVPKFIEAARYRPPPPDSASCLNTGCQPAPQSRSGTAACKVRRGPRTLRIRWHVATGSRRGWWPSSTTCQPTSTWSRPHAGRSPHGQHLGGMGRYIRGAAAYRHQPGSRRDSDQVDPGTKVSQR